MAGGLENLAQHILGDSGIESTHIQCPFVWLRSGASRDVARLAAGGRHGIARHGRADGRRDGIVVLWDDHRS